MAEKRRFKVPSLDDDGDSTPEQFRPQSLFAANRPKLKSTTERGESSEKVQISERSSANKSKVADKQPTALKDTSKSQPIISQQTFQKQPIGSQQQIVSKPDNSKATKLTESPNINIEETVTKTLMYKPIQTLQKPASEEVKASVLPANPIKSANNCILVSPRQRGNPILKFIRSVPYEFDEIVADYQMGRTTCALYLSLRYHQLNPDYIHERLKQLGRAYDLRVLLAQVDVKDPSHALKDLAKVAILADCTLVAAFSPEEAGRYLETYKAFEAKPPDLIMEKTEGTYLSRFSDCLTSVKKINKTDAMTLLSTFGTFESLVQSSEEDLSLCPGFGPQKAQRLSHVLREPFLKPTTKRKVTTTEETVTEGGAAASSSVGKDKA